MFIFARLLETCTQEISFTDLSFLGEATKVPQVAGLPELPKVPTGHITIGLMT